MPNERISIKGTSSGLTISLGTGSLKRLLEELDHSLGERASFFKGGRVALQVGPRQLTRPQLENIGYILDLHGVTLWAVEGDSAGTQEAAAQLGLETSVKTARPPVAESQPPGHSLENSIVIRRTLRSGQVIDHPGNVIIIGDVNPGAEIRAGGSVIVWGRLRGTVHAGADDGQRDEAVVCALQLSPMQLRIGDFLTRSPTDIDDRDLTPELASIQNGQIVAEPWRS